MDELAKQVRAWADSLVAVLPRGLPLIDDEYDILALFLAQQRRRNLELDEQSGEETLRSRLAQFIPFLAEDEDAWEIDNAAHRMVSTHLEADIERATDLFCREHDLPGLVEPVIDWRVAIRYLAQRLHHIASRLDLIRELAASPLRFELALAARDLAADAVDKRQTMLTLLNPAESS